MLKVNIHEAKANLSKYVRKLRAGSESVVVLCVRNVPVAEIRAIAERSRRPRPVGLAREEFKVPDTFFEPLPDALVRSFRGEDA